MKLEDFQTPQWVWVNAPSTIQYDHKYHGKRGLAVLNNASKRLGTLDFFFVDADGNRIRALVDPANLCKWNKKISLDELNKS